MPRATLPWVVAVLGIVFAVALGLTTYTAPIEGAASDPDLYNFLALAAGQPLLTVHPTPGPSPLPLQGVPRPPGEAGTHEERAAFPDSSQPSRWARSAAAADSQALRDWLGRWVIATSAVSATGTLELTLHRLSIRPGCPLFSTLTAGYVSSRHDGKRLVHLKSTCPQVQVE